MIQRFPRMPRLKNISINEVYKVANLMIRKKTINVRQAAIARCWGFQHRELAVQFLRKDFKGVYRYPRRRNG